MKKAKILIFLAVFLIIISPLYAKSQSKPSEKQVSIEKNETRLSEFTLLVENEDGRQVKLSLADLSKLKRQSIKVNDHGEDATFEGFPLVEALKIAGIELGETLRGKRLASYLLVEAADKYQAVFTLTELEPLFTDKLVLLSDKRDGKPLSEKEGFIRIIVPDEKKQGRWVRQVTALKIIRAPVANY